MFSFKPIKHTAHASSDLAAHGLKEYSSGEEDSDEQEDEEYDADMGNELKELELSGEDEEDLEELQRKQDEKILKQAMQGYGEDDGDKIMYEDESEEESD